MNSFTEQCFFIFLIFGFYFFVIQFRRHRYRVLAKRLSAQFVSEGPFRTGKITGKYNDQTFQIIAVAGDWLAGNGFKTTVSLNCNNQGINLTISPSFFNNFSDWKLIVTYEATILKKFFPQLDGKNFLNEFQQQQALETFSGLGEGIFPHLQSTDKEMLDIESDRISWVIKGILEDRSRIEAILKLLQAISKRIESSPIKSN